jgi:hypothetical protein
VIPFFEKLKRRNLLVVVWLLLAGGFILAFTQHVGGWPFLKPVELDLSQKASVRKNAVRLLLPIRYRTHLVADKILVFEDGKRLEKRRSVNETKKLGYGRYQASEHYLYFSASDNSAPLANGRRYSILVPYEVPVGILWGLLLGVILVGKFALTGRREAEGGFWTDTKIACVVAMLSVIASACAYKYHLNRSEGFFLVKGVPFSDASGWTELAISLKDGRGFTSGFAGHRPFYSLFMGAVYSIFGRELHVAKMTNILVLAMATGFAYLFGAITWSRLAGLGLAVWILADPTNHEGIHRLMTEDLAFGLGVLAFFFLAAAFQKGNQWLFLLGGVLLAMSNLSRPFSLLGTLFFGFIFLAMLLRKGDRWALKDVLVRGVCFSAGILVVFVPWCVRQKVAYDSFSPSINSSVLMYAGAAPGIGHSDAWNAGHVLEAQEAGVDLDDVKATADYFSERYAEVVAADRGAYVKRVTGACFDFYKQLTFDEPWKREVLMGMLAMFVLVTAWRCGDVRVLLLLPAVVLLGSLITEAPLWILLPVSGCVLLLSPWTKGKRFGVALTLCAVAGASILSSLVGNFALNRGQLILMWVIFYVVFLALTHLLEGIAFLLTKKRMHESEMPAVWNLFSSVTLVAFFGVIFMGFSAMAYHNMCGFPSEREFVSLPDRKTRDAEICPELFKNSEPVQYFTDLVELGDYRISLSANEDVGHWGNIFAPQPFDRILIKPRYAQGKMRDLLVPFLVFTSDFEKLPDAGILAVTGIRQDLPDGDALIQVISITPLNQQTGQLNFGQTIEFRE